jgi:hypothetical protein
MIHAKCYEFQFVIMQCAMQRSMRISCRPLVGNGGQHCQRSLRRGVPLLIDERLRWRTLDG